MIEIKRECILVITADSKCGYCLEQAIENKNHDYTGMYKPPSFVSFISCCDNSDSRILKFAVSCGLSDIYDLKRVIIKFDKPIDAVLEVKCSNETVYSDKFCADSVEISQSENSELLKLRFSENDDGESDDSSEQNEKKDELLSQKQSLQDNININSGELERLAGEIKELREKNSEILEQTNDLRLEAEEYKKDLDEYKKIRNLKETFERNVKESSVNEADLDMISTQLRYLGNVLEYYKDDTGYITVHQKLDMIKEETRKISEHIALMCDSRARRIQGIIEKIDI
ncbi:MAG: hypothetical protein Q4F95_14490 [Oscillospiraceae bacterium]|nr:hypothetical protein [Oscillospiraceae bacterium]